VQVAEAKEKELRDLKAEMDQLRQQRLGGVGGAAVQPASGQPPAPAPPPPMPIHGGQGQPVPPHVGQMHTGHGPYHPSIGVPQNHVHLQGPMQMQAQGPGQGPGPGQMHGPGQMPGGPHGTNSNIPQQGPQGVPNPKPNLRQRSTKAKQNPKTRTPSSGTSSTKTRKRDTSTPSQVSTKASTTKTNNQGPTSPVGDTSMMQVNRDGVNPMPPGYAQSYSGYSNVQQQPPPHQQFQQVVPAQMPPNHPIQNNFQGQQSNVSPNGTVPPSASGAATVAAQAQSQQQPVTTAPPLRSNTTNGALSGNISLINTMHRDDIKSHIAALQRFSSQIKPSDLKQKLMELLRRQTSHEYAFVFCKPVDPIAMNIPDYFDVIKEPMDHSTIKRRLESNYYRSLKAFAKDMLLVYDNAITYNPEAPDGYGIHETAKEYAQGFVADYNRLLVQVKREEDLKRKNPELCRLCGTGQFTFEPPVLYCNGKCNSKIKRGAHYYRTPDQKMFWCITCYNALSKDSIKTEEGQVIDKSTLEKKKNSEVTEESWVQCNQCNRWFHQICSLFNSRKDESESSKYYCPMCILRYLDKKGIERIEEQPNKSRGYRAKDLPRCQYSDFIEERVKRRILEERVKRAKELGIGLCDVPEPGELTVRVILHKDTEVLPRANLERLYKDKPYNYATSFPHKVKCVLLFQKIDGVDVLFFALYTQSYGSDAPAPNSRCVYIAYLDSVFYMEPRFMRTPVYHEILIAMLEYEKNRGHTKAFIWACPPLQGDDYILYCHPKEQRTQKAEMLRNWYLRLLEDARKRKIIVSIDNLYDAYIRRMCNPCGIPNFDGDYWPGVTEQIIEEFEREKVDPKKIAPRAKRALSRNKNPASTKSKAQSKSKKAKTTKTKKRAKTKYRASARNSARQKSSGAASTTAVNTPTEEDEDDDPLWPPPAPAKFIEVAQQDALTAKIGETIKPMKDDFFVVYMHHICAECHKNIDQPDEMYWLPKDYEDGMGDLDLVKNKHVAPYALCLSCYEHAYKEELGKDFEMPSALPPTLEEKKVLDKRNAETKKGSGNKKASETATATVKGKRKPTTEVNGPEKKRAKEGSSGLSTQAAAEVNSTSSSDKASAAAGQVKPDASTTVTDTSEAPPASAGPNGDKGGVETGAGAGAETGTGTGTGTGAGAVQVKIEPSDTGASATEQTAAPKTDAMDTSGPDSEGKMVKEEPSESKSGTDAGSQVTEGEAKAVSPEVNTTAVPVDGKQSEAGADVEKQDTSSGTDSTKGGVSNQGESMDGADAEPKTAAKASSPPAKETTMAVTDEGTSETQEKVASDTPAEESTQAPPHDVKEESESKDPSSPVVKEVDTKPSEEAVTKEEGKDDMEIANEDDEKSDEMETANDTPQNDKGNEKEEPNADSTAQKTSESPALMEEEKAAEKQSETPEKKDANSDDSAKRSPDTREETKTNADSSPVDSDKEKKDDDVKMNEEPSADPATISGTPSSKANGDEEEEKKSEDASVPGGGSSDTKMETAEATESVPVKEEKVEDGAVVKMEDESDEPPPPPPQGVRVHEEFERFLEPDIQAKPQNAWLIRPCTLLDMKLQRCYIEPVTTDPDPTIDNQFFDTRQQFLSLCQGNHYQFDQLRRAKHSSMMVLYHLHNPEEPGFVHSCNRCQTELKDDSWYTCPTCQDFDLCKTCHGKVGHQHEMKKNVDEKARQRASTGSNRDAKIERHNRLLTHASRCEYEDECPDPEFRNECSKMKRLLHHGYTCNRRPREDEERCRICRRIWLLLQIHAQRCRDSRCQVWRCREIKNIIRRRQAEMADRRIRAQTDRMNAERAAPIEGQNGAAGVGVDQPHYGSQPPSQQGE